MATEAPIKTKKGSARAAVQMSPQELEAEKTKIRRAHLMGSIDETETHRFIPVEEIPGMPSHNQKAALYYKRIGGEFVEGVDGMRLCKIPKDCSKLVEQVAHEDCLRKIQRYTKPREEEAALSADAKTYDEQQMSRMQYQTEHFTAESFKSGILGLLPNRAQNPEGAADLDDVFKDGLEVPIDEEA